MKGGVFEKNEVSVTSDSFVSNGSLLSGLRLSYPVYVYAGMFW